MAFRIALAAMISSASAADFYLGSWSYTQSASDDPQAMWTVEDFVRNTTDTGTGAASTNSDATVSANASAGASGNQAPAAVPWQNIILACGAYATYAKLSSDILRRTGVAVPVMWAWDAWASCNGNTTAMRASWVAFTAEYAALRNTPSGAHLPATPFGVSLGDEPGLRNNATGNATTSALASALGLVKAAYPRAVTHINLLYGTLACDSGTDASSYCCCSMEREGFGSATGIARRLVPCNLIGSPLMSTMTCL